MIKKKKKEVTLADLAGMVQRGFVGVDARLDKVDARLDTVDKRMDGVQEKLDGMDKRMDTLEHGQEDIKLRLDNVAYHFETKRLEERVTSLERKMAKM